MGIKALRRIYKENREILRGATVTDIIIGKGAACFLIAGGHQTFECWCYQSCRARHVAEGWHPRLPEADCANDYQP